MGAWINYGLGSENENLPGFITINPSGSHGGAGAWSPAFLPARHGGTRISGSGAEMKIPFIEIFVGLVSECQDTLFKKIEVCL